MRWDATQRKSGTYAKVRSHGRLHVDIEVSCERTSGRSIRGVVRDLSLTGLCVEAFDSPVYGEALLVRMRLPGAEREGRFRATVRWVQRGEFGAQFDALSVDARADLARAVRQLLCTRAS